MFKKATCLCTYHLFFDASSLDNKSLDSNSYMKSFLEVISNSKNLILMVNEKVHEDNFTLNLRLADIFCKKPGG